jgi:hypothetical protein
MDEPSVVTEKPTIEGQPESRVVSWGSFFFNQENEWELDASAGHNIQKTELKVLTLNQWFSSFMLPSRVQEQISVFVQLDPDVICLQES